MTQKGFIVINLCSFKLCVASTLVLSEGENAIMSAFHIQFDVNKSNEYSFYICNLLCISTRSHGKFGVNLKYKFQRCLIENAALMKIYLNKSLVLHILKRNLTRDLSNFITLCPPVINHTFCTL